LVKKAQRGCLVHLSIVTIITSFWNVRYVYYIRPLVLQNKYRRQVGPTGILPPSICQCRCVRLYLSWPRLYRLALKNNIKHINPPLLPDEKPVRRGVNDRLASTYKKAVLSQGEPRDAAVNFDTYPILE